MNTDNNPYTTNYLVILDFLSPSFSTWFQRMNKLSNLRAILGELTNDCDYVKELTNNFQS